MKRTNKILLSLTTIFLITTNANADFITLNAGAALGTSYVDESISLWSSDVTATNLLANSPSDVAIAGVTYNLQNENIGVVTSMGVNDNKPRPIYGAEDGTVDNPGVGDWLVGYTTPTYESRTAVVTGVANGSILATSTDAINGSQLFATISAINAVDEQVKTNTTNITSNTTNIADHETRITQNRTDIDNIDSRVTTNTGNIATNITSIADNTHKIEANYQDLDTRKADKSYVDTNIEEGDKATLYASFDYADSLFSQIDNYQPQIDDLRFDLNMLDTKVEKYNIKLSSGIATAVAIANLPQPLQAGDSMFSLAVGNYEGTGALAAGVSHAYADRSVIKASFAVSRSQRSGGVGFGFKF